MKLYYDKRLSDPTYYVQIGIRNGKKVTSKNIMKIGKHSELLKSHPDPLLYAKEFIRQLNENDSVKNIELFVNLNEKLPDQGLVYSKRTDLNIGYLILSQIYHDLRLNTFFHDLNDKGRFKFDSNVISRFLTFARILDPRSKLGTYDSLDRYFELPDFDYQHIHRFLDLLYDNFDSYLEYLYKQSSSILKRDTSVCYFDCTNFFFEIEEDDPDYIDEVTGEVFSGLRKYGMSKQHQPSPIVQMGLFMDKDGIPLTMCITPGNDNETKCAIPLEEKLIRQLKDKKFVYCADAGLSSYDIRRFNSFSERAFIVTQSIKKLSDPLKEAVFNDFDYRLLSDDTAITIEKLKGFDKTKKENLALYNDKAYKVIEAEKLIDVGLYEEKILQNGKISKVKSKAAFKQRIIITFSRKMMEYQRHVRSKQIERARRLIESNRIEKLKKGPNDVTRFIKKTNRQKDQYALDEEMIRNEEKYDGYYAVATNLTDHPKDIIAINAQRYKIEDCFRVMKSSFLGRPAYHHKREHIIAHFMICYTALMIYRLLEVQLDRNGTHFTTREIIETLKSMNVDVIDNFVVKSLYTNSNALQAMMGIYPLELDRKYYLKKDLDKIVKKIAR